MDIVSFNKYIRSFLLIDKIEIENQRQVNYYISEIERFDKELNDFLTGDFQSLSFYELSCSPYHPHLHDVLGIFEKCIEDIKQSEGIDFHKTRCLFILSIRLIAFFMTYMNDYYVSIGRPDRVNEIVGLFKI